MKILIWEETNLCSVVVPDDVYDRFRDDPVGARDYVIDSDDLVDAIRTEPLEHNHTQWETTE